MSSDKSTPRFANVSCSQCGRDFGPGDHGFSHCQSHTPNGWSTPRPWTLAKWDAIVGGEMREFVNGTGMEQIAMACSVEGGAEVKEANAELIVRAVNSYDARQEVREAAEGVITATMTCEPGSEQYNEALHRLAIALSLPEEPSCK